jgi:hypothetical protein
MTLVIHQTLKTRCGLSHKNFYFFHLLCNRTAQNCPVPLKLVVMVQKGLFYSFTEFWNNLCKAHQVIQAQSQALFLVALYSLKSSYTCHRTAMMLKLHTLRALSFGKMLIEFQIYRYNVALCIPTSCELSLPQKRKVLQNYALGSDTTVDYRSTFYNLFKVKKAKSDWSKLSTRAARSTVFLRKCGCG